MLIAVIAGCIAVTALVYGLLSRPVSDTQRRLDAVIASRPVQSSAQSPRERETRPPRSEALRAWFRQMLPSRLNDRLAAMLLAAGMNAQPETVALIWGGLTVGLPGFYLFLTTSRGGAVGKSQ